MTDFLFMLWRVPLSSLFGATVKPRLKKSKSIFYYTRVHAPKRVTSGEANLRDLAPGLHSSEEKSQRWRAVGDTVPI